MTYTAQYSSTVNEYTVTWIVDGKETTELYEYGATPSFKGSTDKAADAQYTYTFTGWDKEIAAVTGDVTYTATYDKTVNSYTVTWIVDGKETTETYEYGATPSFKGSTDKAGNAQYTYNFTGWDKEIKKVTEDVTYTATYTSTVRTYTVTWKNEDGTVLETDEDVPYDTSPTYNGDTPTKEGDAQYTYTFSGWTPEIASVTGTATYTAKFDRTPIPYTITYELNGGTLPEGEENPDSYTVESSFTLNNPTKPGYTFLGWTGTGLDAVTKSVEILKGSTGNRNYTAVWGAKLTATIDHGEISLGGSTHVQNYALGELKDHQIVFSPTAGYKIVQVSVNGVALDASEFTETGYTYLVGADGLQENTTIQVTTEKLQVEIKVIVIGSGDNTQVITVQQYSDVLIAITPKPGTTLNSIELKYANGETAPVTPNENGYIFTAANIDQNVSITIGVTSQDVLFAVGAIEKGTVALTYGETTVTSVDGAAGKYLPYDAQYSFTLTADPNNCIAKVNDELQSGWPVVYRSPIKAMAEDTRYIGETERSYTITFDSNGGSAVNPIAAPGEAQVTLPEAPTRDGYAFTGWKYDGNIHEAGASFTMPTHDLIFTAQWVDARLGSPYTVYVGINMSFYVEDGNFYYTIPEEPVDVGVDTKCARVYLNNGVWTIQQNGYNKSLTGIPADYISENLFNPDAALYGGKYEEYYKTNGETICIYDKTGVVPKKLLSFSETDYKGIIQAWKNAGESYLSSEYGVNLNWNAIDVNDHVVIPYVIKRNDGKNWFIDVLIRPKQTYSITYDRNVQAGYPEMETVVKSGYGENYPVKLETQGNITKTDNSDYVAKFLGWHYDKDGDNEVDAGEVLASGGEFVMPGEDITLTALWEYPVDYTVQYYLKNPENGEYTVKETEAKIGYVGDDVTITKTYTGYNLGSTEAQTIVANNHVVKGYYDPITYTVKFRAGEQELTQLLTYDKPEKLLAYSFSKPGFAFAGWSKTSGGPKEYDDGASVVNLANTQDAVVDLYALFAPIKLTIIQAGMKNNADSGVYEVVNDSGVVATVVITGNNSVVLTQIPAGTYTIREITENWTWTYEDTGNDARPNVQVTVQANVENQVTFNHTSKTVDWLHNENSY